MKKLFASVGLAALGASLQAQPTPGISSDQMNNQRGWSLATALRGFYDDNYLTEPNPSKRSSYGFEVTPLASFTHTENSGSVSLSYIYDYKYYLDHSVTDTSHQFNANVVFCDGHVDREKPVPGSLDQRLPAVNVARLRSEILTLP